MLRTSRNLAWYDGSTWSLGAFETTDTVSVEPRDIVHLGPTGMWVSATRLDHALLYGPSVGSISVKTHLGSEIRKIWSAGENEAWLWTRNTTWFWDGTDVTALGVNPCDSGPEAVDGTSADDVWITCRDGVFSSGLDRPWQREGSAWGRDIHVTDEHVTVLTDDGVLVKRR